MPPLTFSKNDLPFGNGISGNINLSLDQSAPALLNPINPSSNTTEIATASFGVAGAPPFKFGASQNVNLSIDAGISASLDAYFSPGASLDAHGVGDFLKNHPDSLILALDIAAHAKAGAAGSYSYGVLSADASIEAEASGELWFSRAYPRATILADVLKDFFANLRAPSNLSAPPAPGESIYYEFDGYVNLAADISAGYEMKGTHDFSIANLLLSEHYDFSILGKLGVQAAIAGRYSVEVTGVTDPDTGNPVADWARVVVQKKHSDTLSFAADINVGITSDTSGLPGTAKEFLGALLGTNAKSWLNWADKILDNADPNTLKNTLDTLSEQFLSKWTNKAFNLLSQTELNALLGDVHKIVQSYNNLDTTAINLFDKYFDMGAVPLTNLLTKLQDLTSLKDLEAKLSDNSVVPIIEELTGGDPLSWILGTVGLSDANGNPITNLLAVFNSRVQDALSLIQDNAHDLIRKWITQAKSLFGIDGFMEKLNGIGSLADLKNLADTKLNGLVERIIGTTIDKLDQTGFGKVLKGLQNFSAHEQSIYEKFSQALQQTASLSLHAAYSRTAEQEALLDVQLNLGTANGRKLLCAAAVGDFTQVLRGYQPGVVRILGGKLHRALTEQNILTFNVAGWHLNWNYQSCTTLLTSLDQNIVPGDNGALTVFTNVTMKEARDVTVNQQEMHSNFLLRLLGESHGTIDTPPQFGKDDHQYLVDTVSQFAVSYSLTLESHTNTSLARLTHLLSFASAFDLVQAGATAQGLAPYLESKKDTNNNDDFGDVQVDYEVRYNEDALTRFFSATLNEAQLRAAARQTVFVTWWDPQNTPHNAQIARVYASDSGYKLYTDLGPGLKSFTGAFPLGPAPFGVNDPHTQISLSSPDLITLYALYQYEDTLAAGITKLFSMLRSTSNHKLSPVDFQKAMGKLGTAFAEFDEIATNVAFALWDRLIASTQPPANARISSLKITSNLSGTPRVKMLIGEPALPQVGAAPATP
ncbi:hypothetical protein Acid345_2053 [Candidatus Koribacter versatilis Ellin345]|uniref:Uncharacterized protein n=1 Tax=Koribacter versatilis (strain Ellin345) TaxID=204669 RepID=Q1IPZ6_KORVE|nr:hypothetical protein [Candidatus Koribacter versatilis]ABF41054.1 hypothetical protein Acid345_2053 [Candidatus Koribacter versatilis Ellin345]